MARRSWDRMRAASRRNKSPLCLSHVFQLTKVPDYNVSTSGGRAMRSRLEHPNRCNCVARRDFLKFTAGAAAALSAGALALSYEARADALSREMRETMTPD